MIRDAVKDAVSDAARDTETGVTVAGGPFLPMQLFAGDFSVVPNGTAGEAVFTINAYNDGGAAIDRVIYNIDGATFVNPGLSDFSLPITWTVTGISAGARAFRVRIRNSVGFSATPDDLTATIP
jgi:hypothetical protein